MPLIGCHADGSLLADVRERLLGSACWSDLRQAVQATLSGNHGLSGLVPGGTPWQRVSGFAPGHTASMLSAYQMIEPDDEVAAVLIDFLHWSRAQSSLMLGSGIAAGQFCRGLVLALDAVGETLPHQTCREILDHLILCCVENPDADDIMNHHPVGMPPLVDYLAIPGTGFHLKDGQVNNWDAISAMALFYIVRAMAVVMPERAAAAGRWLDLVGRRLERFFRLCFSDRGEYCEGPGYYSYGCMAAVSMLDVLSRWPERRQMIDDFDLCGLYATPDWSREMYHGELRHGHFNYNDCLRFRPERAAVVHWLAARTGNAEAQYFADQLWALPRTNAGGENQDLESDVFSCLWRDPALVGRPPSGRRAVWFGRTGTAICRTGYADDDVHWALRAGDYVGAHTHPSRGNVLLSMGGADLLSDAGMPADRTIPAYRSYHCSTAAHNCLLIDGQGQITEADDGYPAGHITRFETRDDGVLIAADCSAVYANADLVRRHLYLSWRGWALLHDRVAGRCREVTVMLHTARQGDATTVACDALGLTIRQPQAALRVHYVSGIAAAVDAGNEYHESEPTGQRAIHLHAAGLESVILLVPYLTPSATPEIAVTLLADAWQVTIDGVCECVPLDYFSGSRKGGD